MYILSGGGMYVVNSEFVERFCIAVKEDACLVVASYHSERPAVTLARYADEAEARDVLLRLYSALSGGQICFDMPESLLYASEHIKRDARTKRRGGS